MLPTDLAVLDHRMPAVLEIPETSHLVPFERPLEVADAVIAFFREHNCSRRGRPRESAK